MGCLIPNKPELIAGPNARHFIIHPYLHKQQCHPDPSQPKKQKSKKLHEVVAKTPARPTTVTGMVKKINLKKIMINNNYKKILINY